MNKKGLVIIHTGDGKGKTTAAFGQAMRAVGNGFAVSIIQFIKGRRETGEAKAVAAFADRMELHIMGSGFTWQQKNKETVIEKAKAGWMLAREKIMSGGYDLVVLDELTYLINYNIVPESEVVSLLRNRPEGLHVVITGRGASPGLIEAADLVTEMKAVKHPFEKGVKAQRGIEF